MPPPKTAGAPRGTIPAVSHQNLVTCTIRAAPVPEPINNFLRSNIAVLKRLQNERAAAEDGAEEAEIDEAETAAATGDIIRVPTVRAEMFWDALAKVCTECGGEWMNIVDTIWAFGPQNAGECLLIDARKDGAPNS